MNEIEDDKISNNFDDILINSDQSDEKDHRMLFRKYLPRILGLCIFIWCMGFKPSEPYLSQYLICNQVTESDICSSLTNCNVSPCNFTEGICGTIPCQNVELTDCRGSNSDFSYCEISTVSNTCTDSTCYQSFSEKEVNNEIYPWSTYSYFPLLLILTPVAELFSYRVAILSGIAGRVATRFFLLFGSKLWQMQLMQVTYSFGTVAEDIFFAYIYYVVPTVLYTDVTAYVKSSALIASMLAGILGDILVTQFSVGINVLMIISACFVCSGAFIGLFVITDKKLYKKNSLNLQENSLIESSIYSVVNLANRYDTIVLLYREKIRKLKNQIQLLSSINDSDLLILILYWIFGNAVFTIVYGYEVSIYIELNGNNNWNGSVLAIMLVGGTLGSMCPSFLDTGSMKVSIRRVYILLSEVLSVLSLFAALYFWNIIVTVIFLTIYFSSWQFVNVITLAELATRVKKTQSTFHQQEAINTENPIHIINEDAIVNIDEIDIAQQEVKVDPPYSIAIIFIIAICSIVQIILQAILFSGLQLSLRVALWIICVILFISTLMHIVGVFYQYQILRHPDIEA